jgi:hypothetical protein
MGSGLTVDTLEYIIFSGHVAAPEPSTWWGQVLFTTRPEIAARAPRLGTVVRDTPVSGYRQAPFHITRTKPLCSVEMEPLNFIFCLVVLRAPATQR